VSRDDINAAPPAVEESPPEEFPPEESPTEGSPPEESPTAAMRQRLVRQFERWVDQMLAGEPRPPGLPEELLAGTDLATSADPGRSERECDLYTLFAALTTLTGEIRLQGRAFKQLADTLAPLAEVPRQLERLETAADQRGGGDALPVSGEAVLDVMLDLCDRLERGLRICDGGIAALRAPKRGWLRRRVRDRSSERATAAVEAIRDASALTLQRLESVLRDWGVERIGRAGETFDPERMTAVQVRPAQGVEPGTVLEVNRAGYARNGRVRATAQVTVARAESMTGQSKGER
jgi:molecular chaperone GrpE